MVCQRPCHDVVDNWAKNRSKTAIPVERFAAILSQCQSWLTIQCRSANCLAWQSLQRRVAGVAAFFVRIIAPRVVTADERPTIVRRMVLIAAMQQVGVKE